MSKHRFAVSAVVDTLAHANTVKSQLELELIGKDIFETHSLAVVDDPIDGKIHFDADIRFNSRINRDDIVTWIKNQVQTHPLVKNWVQSVSVTNHLCTHDDTEVKDCKTTEFFRWNRV